MQLGRGSLRSGSRGEVSGQLGLGEDVAQFASGTGMLSLGTLPVLLAGWFSCLVPRDNWLIKCIATVRFVRQA